MTQMHLAQAKQTPLSHAVIKLPLTADSPAYFSHFSVSFKCCHGTFIGINNRLMHTNGVVSTLSFCGLHTKCATHIFESIMKYTLCDAK